MRSITRFANFGTMALSIFAGIAVVLLMIHVTVDVIFRSGLGNSLPGTIAVVQNYYMIVIVCLPLALVERRDGHISVDVVTNLLPDWFTSKLFGWTFLFAAAVFGLIAYGSWIEALTQYKAGKFLIEKDIKIITWIGYFAVPLGYGMGTLYALIKFVRFLTGLPPSPDAETEHDTDYQVEHLGHD